MSPIWKICGAVGAAAAALGRSDEGADDAVGDDVQDIVDRLQLGGGLDVAFDLRLLLRRQRLDGKAGARLPEQADGDADDAARASRRIRNRPAP